MRGKSLAQERLRKKAEQSKYEKVKDKSRDIDKQEKK